MNDNRNVKPVKSSDAAADTGRRRFLKSAAVVAAALVATDRLASSSPDRILHNGIGADSINPTFAGDSEQREALYYRPLFEKGKGLAG
jgi:hypothetical protein